MFRLAQYIGASDVSSYLTGSVGPVAGGFAVWARARRFSGASDAIFAFTVLSALVALVGSTTTVFVDSPGCPAPDHHSAWR